MSINSLCNPEALRSWHHWRGSELCSRSRTTQGFLDTSQVPSFLQLSIFQMIAWTNWLAYLGRVLLWLALFKDFVDPYTKKITLFQPVNVETKKPPSPTVWRHLAFCFISSCLILFITTVWAGNWQSHSCEGSIVFQIWARRQLNPRTLITNQILVTVREFTRRKRCWWIEVWTGRCKKAQGPPV